MLPDGAGTQKRGLARHSLRAHPPCPNFLTFCGDAFRLVEETPGYRIYETEEHTLPLSRSTEANRE